ncbi:MAG: discoidin domain-containing protein [Bacteroidetes bacterium]|nr:discoidin domain-containing protein [Bacteroidota bacterium]
MRLTKIKTALFLFSTLFIFNSCVDKIKESNSINITPPKLTNNPSYDVICTVDQPLLTFYNSSGGIGELHYTIQISEDRNFNYPIVEYSNIYSATEYITTKLIEEHDRLTTDKQYYYWRVKAIDSKQNESKWASSRFYLDTSSDDSFMNLVRIDVKSVTVSSGANSKNICDITDIGNTTHWEPPPPGDTLHWVKFELANQAEISRIWMLSNPDGKEGWLTNFYWMSSLDGNIWSIIDDTEITNNDTYRNIIDFQPHMAKYLKLVIKDYYGYAPQLFTTIFYSRGMPPPPVVPNEDYVLIVGDQLNGFTFTELAKHIENLDLNLKTVTVPHYMISLEILESLSPQPVAIVFSGNNANYPNLPMYEFNGGFEIVRNNDIPILGICAGHQLEVMAYGYTYAHSTGWFDNTIIDIETAKIPDSIRIVVDSPIFKNIPNPFFGVEIHSWATSEEVFPMIGFELLAKSSYVQAQKIKGRMVFGEQFHAEIDIAANQAKPVIYNFLTMALEKRNSDY